MQIAFGNFIRLWSVGKAAELDMGGYADYCMSDPEGHTVAGICHARGVNADLPAQWLVYVRVASLEQSMAAVRTHGGRILVQPKALGAGRYCVIRDPAGAVIALLEE